MLFSTIPGHFAVAFKPNKSPQWPTDLDCKHNTTCCSEQEPQNKQMHRIFFYVHLQHGQHRGISRTAKNQRCSPCRRLLGELHPGGHFIIQRNAIGGGIAIPVRWWGRIVIMGCVELPVNILYIELLIIRLSKTFMASGNGKAANFET